MVAHAAYPKLDLQESDQNGKLLPASLSHSFVTQLLRSELGFDGLVLTDDLEMGAILKNYGVGEACKLALKAGVDMLSICAAPEAIYEGFSAVLDSLRSGELTEQRIDESLGRIASAKTVLNDPLSFDQARLDELSLAIADLNDRLK
jgi:beta-N-acetylhexosaminidase